MGDKQPAQSVPAAPSTSPPPTTQSTDPAKTTASIQAGRPITPRKAAPVAPEMRVAQPQTSLPTRNTNGQPAAQKPPTQKTRNPQSASGNPNRWWAQLGKIRWVLALGSLGSALLAQKIANDVRVANSGEGVPPLASWLLFGLAAVLFVVAIPSSPTPPTGQPTPFLATLRALPRRRRILFLGLAGAAISCDIVATPLFIVLNSAPPNVALNWPTNTGSWLLYIVGLLLFGAAWAVWERSVPALDDRQSTVDAGRPLSEDGSTQIRETAQSSVVDRPASATGLLPSKVEWIIMGALTLLALALRLPGLDSAPPGLWFDEAQNGIVARGLMDPTAFHATFIQGFTQMGALYFYALGRILDIFGTTAIWPLRLMPAIAGTLLVPMIYLIGSRLYGWRVGVAAGVMLAVSAWNITFSRFGIASLPTVALDVGVFLCLLQGLRTGRLGYYAGAGVLMGLALQMYYPSQLVPVVLALVFLFRLVTERMRFWRAIRGGIVLVALGLVVAFLPVATFAIQHLDVYTSRAGTVSIFTPEGSDGHPDALQISLGKHALMFNYAGDGNGRHNIPTEPMLDWWMGAFFITGLGVCLLRLRRWHYFFPLMWFVASMSGGVLTVVFEAPQSHRTLETSVISALIAGIFVGELWRALTPITKRETQSATTASSPQARLLAQIRGTQPATIHVSRFTFRFSWPALLISGLALVLLFVTSVSNIDRYFNRQMNDQGVWQDMSTPDRAIGSLVAQYNKDHAVYISAVKTENPSTSYLAPGAFVLPWPGMYTFPLLDARDTVIILTPSDGYDVATIKRIYKNAVVNVVYGPDKNSPQLYSITIPTGDIVAARGVHATLYPKDPAKPPVDETLQNVEFTPTAQQAQDFDRVRLSTTFEVINYAGYRFQLAGADASQVISGSVLVDGFDVSAGTAITLGLGLHSVVATAPVSSTAGTNKLQLLWGNNIPTSVGMRPFEPAYLFDPRKIEPRGLTGIFRQGDFFDVPPAAERVDPTISFYFHLTPLPRPYTGEWLGKLYVPVDGTYMFQTEQISRSQLFIDGQQIVANSQSNTAMNAPMNLTKGLHDIRVLYEDLESFSHLYLYWTPPGLVGQYIIPSAFLLPVMGTYPDKPESGDWPTIDEADDTNWSKSAEGGDVGQSTVAGQPQPTPAEAQQPTPQPAEASTQAPPTPKGQTAVQRIQPLVTLGQSGEVLNRPKAVAVDAEGNIYIYTETDTYIRKISPDGKTQKSWVVQNKDGTPATEISALVVKDGKLLALDSASSEILTYGLDGSGGERTQLCTCFFPRGMSLSNDGNFWVADTGGSRVLKVGPDGKVIASIEGRGSEPGQFLEPASTWEAPNGTLYVVDVGNARVQSFSPDLKPITSWPIGSSIARDGNRITGDENGELVTEADSHAVVRYDPQGKELARWIYEGSTGQLIPSAITPAGSGKFVVLYPLSFVGLVFSPDK